MLSWQQRIDAARALVRRWPWSRPEPIGFTYEDVALAHDWMTCSCGQLDARIPRDFEPRQDGSNNIGCPVDKELAALGVKFSDAVNNDEIDRAEVLYRKVQARAELLIEQIEGKDADTTQTVQAAGLSDA